VEDLTIVDANDNDILTIGEYGHSAYLAAITIDTVNHMENPSMTFFLTKEQTKQLIDYMQKLVDK